MTVKNAMKKLSKYGTVEHQGSSAWIIINNRFVSFLSNGTWDENSSAICFHVRRINDESDIQSDYHAGSFFDNLTQAIRYAMR